MRRQELWVWRTFDVLWNRLNDLLLVRNSRGRGSRVTRSTGNLDHKPTGSVVANRTDRCVLVSAAVTINVVAIVFISLRNERRFRRAVLDMYVAVPPVGPCDDSPCENGGTCVPLGKSTYKCMCMEGWTGVNCETRKYSVTVELQ